MQAYWLVVRVLLTPPAEAAASQKWKIIYLQVLSNLWPGWIGQLVHIKFTWPTPRHHLDMEQPLLI
jgi:hypothetical protein